MSDPVLPTPPPTAPDDFDQRERELFAWVRAHEASKRARGVRSFTIDDRGRKTYLPAEK